MWCGFHHNACMPKCPLHFRMPPREAITWTPHQLHVSRRVQCKSLHDAIIVHLSVTTPQRASMHRWRTLLRRCSSYKKPDTNTTSCCYCKNVWWHVDAPDMIILPSLLPQLHLPVHLHALLMTDTNEVSMCMTTSSTQARPCCAACPIPLTLADSRTLLHLPLQITQVGRRAPS
jgi:hypothetical protein